MGYHHNHHPAHAHHPNSHIQQHQHHQLPRPMDYLKKFFKIERIIGEGSFGVVYSSHLIPSSPLTPKQLSPLPLIPQEQQQPSLEVHNQQQPQQLQLSPITTNGAALNSSPLIHNGNLLATPPANKRTERDPNLRRFALKCIYPSIKPSRLASELRYLRDLGGQKNIVQMHSACLHEGSLFIVMDLIEHDRFVNIVGKLDLDEIRTYMKNLLAALEHVHEEKIMHRDIKPANVLFNRKHRKLLLVDFGLAQPSRAPAKRFINFKATNSPTTPNISTKRLNDAIVPALKNMRVDDKKKPVRPVGVFESPSNVTSDRREPVRLTVGAYESPETHTDNNLMITPTSARNQMMNNRDHKFSTPKIPPRQLSRCECVGKPRTCNHCAGRPESLAPRSGTPGFKAPETLLRYAYQSTAVDIWAAGVIMTCLFAGHYPIFRDTDDLNSLCDIMAILGSQRMIEAAQKLEIRLICKPSRHPIPLKYLCTTIRQSNITDKTQIDLPDVAYDLLTKMLDPNPITRITAHEAMLHPWFESSTLETDTTMTTTDTSHNNSTLINSSSSSVIQPM